MKKLPKILLTGDDGYNSSGIRLLIAALKDKYELVIAATFEQQSAVGGLMHIKDGFDWGLSEVDGVPAFWVKGSPADAMELMAIYYPDNYFDLIVSGVNWGANLGSTVFNSGTVNAALRGLGASVASRAVAMSWDLPPRYYLQGHQGDEVLTDFMEYPGRAIDQVLDIIIDHEYWGAELVNVNFPQNSTAEAVVTKFHKLSKEIFEYPQAERTAIAGKKGGHFTYQGGRMDCEISPRYDAGAVNQRIISISPARLSLLDETVYQQIKDHKFSLK